MKESIIEVEAIENNLRFPGQYWDVESGLLYNWWRFYYAEIGNYMRTDPRIVHESNSIQFILLNNKFETKELNAYMYVMSNPLNNKDVKGLYIIEKGCSYTEMTEIKYAKEKLHNVLNNSDCVKSSELKNCIIYRITTMVIQCTHNGEECGEWRGIKASENDHDHHVYIDFGDNRADECTSVESTLLHELVHSCDKSKSTDDRENRAYACEHSCFGEKHPSNYYKGKPCDCR